MTIQISDHFTPSKLFRFTLSPIFMMILSSIYSVVDGIFVSNYVGNNALAAINIIWPLIMIVGSFGMMLGSGGSAIIAKAFGEKQDDLARQYFTTVVLAIITIGITLSSLCIIFMEPLCFLFGSSELLIPDCKAYGTIMLGGTTLFMLTSCFHTMFSTAGKPRVGLALTTLSGITNMVLDWLFIAILQFGVRGAAIATISSYFVGGFIPLIYFASRNSSTLRFTKTRLYPKMLLKACSNGISEMITNTSGSIVTAFYNIQLMKLLGENGVSAISIIFYVDFVFKATMFGFAIGTAPIIAYNYGADNYKEIKSLFRMCCWIILCFSVIMLTLSELSAGFLTDLFVKNDPYMNELTLHGFRLFAITYGFCGVNIFTSSLFTALSNGKLSGIVSISRALILPSIMIFLLPHFFGIDGVWIATPVSEILAVFISSYFVIANRSNYHYY